ncbi:MAG: 4'-phosphopantetheinyl transferase superfamily protein [Thiogranum sp.]|nr:4'-phosphopantetheinyl transferase superfamily protein [Thiogranum sp.]
MTEDSASPPEMLHTSLKRLQREIHVWFVKPPAITNRLVLDRCRSVLCPDELARYQRFYFEEDRHGYLISHALVRYVLSRYFDIPPKDWIFSRSKDGKPEVTSPEARMVRFNLTHTDGLAACIVTLSDDCGIDAEIISNRHNIEGVANRKFSIFEHEQLKTLSGRQQLEYFFERWTLREAYVKARGIGLVFPMHELTFDISGDRVSVCTAPELDDKNENWTFQLIRPSREHIIAVAVKAADATSGKAVHCQEFAFPGADEL